MNGGRSSRWGSHLLDPESRSELHRLADEVERTTAGIENLAERCLRALISADRVANMVDAGPDDYEVFRRWSGSGRLFDALYALANTITAARMESPDQDPPGEWWARVRTELGVSER